MLGYLSVVPLLALFAVVAGVTSPCPERFKYLEEKSGLWTGELVLESEYVLHGVWARLMFNAPVTSVTPEHFGDVFWSKEEPTEALIKNRDYLVKKNTPFTVKFSVGYEGDKAPELIGFRLNGRTICPVGQDK